MGSKQMLKNFKQGNGKLRYERKKKQKQKDHLVADRAEAD